MNSWNSTCQYHPHTSIYQPALRLHLSGKSLDKYINGDNAMIGDETPTSLIELFDQLANKEIVGNEAKAKCLTLLVNEGIVGEDGVERPELLDVFYRLLDRSLTAGFSASTLKAVNWGPAPAKQGKSKAASKSTDASTINLDSFSCALGKALDPPFNDLFNGKICSRWWASRKLDGVRCVTYVDFFVPKAGDPQVKNIQFLSRKGNEFTSLGNLERQLIGLAQWPGLRELLARDPVVLEEQPGGHVKRLVLDGEVCVMRPMTSEERALREQKDDGCTAAQDLWLNDGLTEDFQATVSRIKRRNQVIPHPAYFVFDVLSAAEFAAQGAVASPGLGLTFGKRIRDIEAMGSFWAQDEHPLIRVLVQREVMTREDLDGMVQRASDEGWEGIMLRADTPYKGKRSKELFKLKKWKEEEYIVVSAHNNVMRLPVDGVFEEREACANVIIEHKGHPVSIGSGFSSEQRLRFARDPGEIVSVRR